MKRHVMLPAILESTLGHSRTIIERERIKPMYVDFHRARALLLVLVAAVAAAGLLTLVSVNPAWAADQSFQTAPNSPFPVGSAPTTVTNADFNGDGKMDLAAQNSGSNNVTVLLGDGNGDFKAATNSPFQVGSSPSSVTSADFNGDKKADLAVTNQGSHNVSILLGDGNGDFKAASNSPFTVGGESWAQPSSVVGANFNGDNKVDLAVANAESHDVSVLLGNGDGNFQAAQNFTMGSNPNQVVTADFNSDGKTDLATANFGRCFPLPSCTELNVAGGFSLRFGKGDGTFQSGVTYEADHAYSITTEDFNGDGRADLAIPLYRSKAVWVQLGKGDGTFQAGRTITRDTNPVAVTSADFDSDNRVDLAVTNYTSASSDNVAVMSGDGNGGFGVPQNLPTGDGPDFVIGANFDANSSTDLAVANEISGNVSVLLNTVVDTTPPTIARVSPANARTDVALTANVKATFSETMDPDTITGQTFSLTSKNSSSPVTANVTYDSASKEAVLDPTVDLEANTSYTATIKGGSSGAKDAAGNALSADETWTFSTVDTKAPPAPTITSPENNSIDNVGTFAISGTAEANSTVELFEGSISRGTATADGSGNWNVQLTGVGEGSHTYTARARDAAGNTSDPSAPLTVDVEIPPFVVSVSPVDQAQNVAVGTNVEVTFSEAMNSNTLTTGTFSLREQNASVQVPATADYNSTTNKATLDPNSVLASNTTYTATIKGGSTGVKDLAGNALQQDYTWTFTTAADTTPPDTTILSGPSGYVKSTSASFAFSSSEEGSTFKCSLDGGAFSLCTSPKDYSGLAQGSHTFRVRAIDGSGNADASPASRTWFVDTVVPRGTISINGGNASTSKRSVTLRLSASDPSPASGVASMRFRNGGTSTWSSWSAYSTSKSWTLTAGAGTKTVYVQYRDNAGNVSASASDTIKFNP